MAGEIASIRLERAVVQSRDGVRGRVANQNVCARESGKATSGDDGVEKHSNKPFLTICRRWEGAAKAVCSVWQDRLAERVWASFLLAELSDLELRERKVCSAPGKIEVDSRKNKRTSRSAKSG